jgi:hypothetical protein
MVLKFLDGAWNGCEITANMAPQFIDLHGIMFQPKEKSESADTTAMDKQKITYQIADVIEEDGQEDVVHYELTG